jgi:hypothetical protein
MQSLGQQSGKRSEVEVTKNLNPRLASVFISKDFSNLGLAYEFLSQKIRFLFAIDKHLSNVLDFCLVVFFTKDFKI